MTTLFLAYEPERHRRHFLELAQDGCKVIVRCGPLGLRGKVTVRHFPTPEAATAAIERLAAQSFHQGYEQVV